ncbi:hypothetical protein SapgrDRAFT_2726 [Saprospira grandis DSM 2844]|uniref:Uncharacterized protein n=1 Tax=Saprospira grandis DSM 2844 TaxID=694433 RepID=J0XYY3_9BACT|nr:hypothetical protein SapgrDRAFT_2726 [Saprospira grandis DSM 2844]
MLQRLLPPVVELRPKDLLVVSQLAAVLGPPACGGRYVSQLAVRSALQQQSCFGLALAGHCCTSLGRLDELNKKRASK